MRRWIRSFPPVIATLAALIAAPAPAEEDQDTVELEFVDRDQGKYGNQAEQEKLYPSAHTCGKCHPQQFREWSVSPHAYATFSPVFQAFNGVLLKRLSGSLGDFCIRCHAATAINLGEPVFVPASERTSLAREGVSCIICHRIKEQNGKVSGRQTLHAGPIFDPVDGPTGNKELKRVIASGEYPVATEPGQRGQAIHTDVRYHAQMTTSGFCGVCHDVTVPNGLRFEDLFSEFRSSPAAAKGTRCQDCHMGRVPGDPDSGFYEGPAAVIDGKPTRIRKTTDHMFIGPDYPIVHPGVFPHNAEAKAFASIAEWFQFDWRAGWGTEEFEEKVEAGEIEVDFPERWADAADREEAREILEEQLKLLAEANTARLALMQAALKPGRWEVKKAGPDGIRYRVEVRNAIDGHSVPAGFDSERLIFMRTEVRDASGKVVYRSGDLDPNGDLRDGHSLYVRNGELPLDRDLFTLQTQTLTRAFRGGEIDSVLPVPVSVTPLPYMRPPSSSSILRTRPRGARKHKRSIPPLGSRWADYTVPAEALAGTTGPYTANIKLIFAEFPVNLIHEVQEVGFDYGMSPRQLADEVVRGHMVIFERELRLEPGQGEFEQTPPVKYVRTVVDGYSRQ